MKVYLYLYSHQCNKCHCERSEAISGLNSRDCFSPTGFAMTPLYRYVYFSLKKRACKGGSRAAPTEYFTKLFYYQW